MLLLKYILRWFFWLPQSKWRRSEWNLVFPFSLLHVELTLLDDEKNKNNNNIDWRRAKPFSPSSRINERKFSVLFIRIMERWRCYVGEIYDPLICQMTFSSLSSLIPQSERSYAAATPKNVQGKTSTIVPVIHFVHPSIHSWMSSSAFHVFSLKYCRNDVQR